MTEPRSAASSRPRPLLVRFGAMGDLVLVQPMIRLLSERFGAPVDILSAGGWVRPLYEGQPGVGEIFLLKKRKLPWWLSAEKRALLAGLRARGPRPVWCCDFDEKLLPLLARAGLGDDCVVRARAVGMHDGEHLVDFHQRVALQMPERFAAWTASRSQARTAGLTSQSDSQPNSQPNSRPNSQPNSQPNSRPPGGKHARGAHEVGSARDEHVSQAMQDPTLHISPAMQADVKDWLGSLQWLGRPLILVQAGNRRTMRTGVRRRMSTNTKWWPEENWAAVIRMLAKRHPEAVILLVGAPPEADLNDELLQRAGVPSAFNVATELPIPRLLALQARAAGMVTVDTGPGHTAAAVGCPLVVLFGVADPVEIRPRGGSTPVHVLQAFREGRPDMTAITVAEVTQAWERLPLRAGANATWMA